MPSVAAYLVSPPLGDLLADATLALAGVTFALVMATVWLVKATRKGTKQAREDANKQLELLLQQLRAERRPLLVDVLRETPIAADVPRFPSPDDATTLIEMPGLFPPPVIDPRLVLVVVQIGVAYVSVPLRNIGRGPAFIEESGLGLHGPDIGALDFRFVQRPHVPVGETTRVYVRATYPTFKSVERGTSWWLTVPYTDFAGEQRTTAKLGLTLQGINWYVTQVVPIPDDPVETT